jgi:hypothetical protein
MPGAEHINADDVSKSWMSDDQISSMSAGVNGPVDRNEVRESPFVSLPLF